MELHGRTVIYTDSPAINVGNIVDILSSALETHVKNRAEIDYLYNYYKGKQPILERTKEFREDINNKIVENRANEIVSFKTGYLMGEPVQYVSRGGADESISDEINTLNDYVFAEDKEAKDKELADWFTICGTSYRMILPDDRAEADESPFEIYTLDPRNTFVVYYSGLGNEPLMGVKYILRQDGVTVYSCYTQNEYFEIESPASPEFAVALNPSGIVKHSFHILGGIPIIEYPANLARLGAFEIVLPLLDAINTIESNRVDGLEQFIQSILVLKGFDLESESIDQIRELGGLGIPQDGDAYYLTQELNQGQTQVLVDYMYQTVLTICGMPNRNGGLSTSDTGSAVIMRDGWSDAEARAKDTELMFKMSEKRFLKLALNIVDAYRQLHLRLSNIEIRFTRRNYENILTKSQVLTTLLANDKIHPKLAFAHCGLFVDPELAYTQSMEYYEKAKAEEARDLATYAENETARAAAAASEEL